MRNGMDAKTLRAAIVRIHERIFSFPFEHFRELALGEIRLIIPFDMAIWGTGIYSTNQILGVSCLDLPALSLLTYAGKWQEQDFVRTACARNPGGLVRLTSAARAEARHQDFRRTPRTQRSIRQRLPRERCAWCFGRRGDVGLRRCCRLRSGWRRSAGPDPGT